MGNILYSYMPENANKQHHGRNVIVFGNTMQQLGATLSTGATTLAKSHSQPRTKLQTRPTSQTPVDYRTRNQDVAGSTHTRSTASNLQEVANLLCAQANSASYLQRDGK